MATEPLDIVKLLLPMVFGSAKTAQTGTSGSTTTGGLSQVGSDAIANIISILQPAASGTNTSATDAVVQNILQKAAIAFAPTGAMENQAGLYNSSVRKLMMNDAMGRAVGESSAAVLQNQTQAQTTMAGLAKTLADATKTTAVAGTDNKTTGTKPLIDPRISAALTAAMLGKSAFSSLGGMLGLGDKFKDPRLGPDGEVLASSPADAEAGLAGDQVASGAGGGPSIAAPGLGGADSLSGSFNPDVTSSSSGLDISGGLDQPAAALDNTSAALDVSRLSGEQLALADTGTTTDVTPGLLSPETTTTAPAATESGVTFNTPVTVTGAVDANGALLPQLAGAEGAATGQSLAGQASMLSADNIPAMDTANAINKLADAGSISGTTTDVTAGMFDSATAAADSASAIPTVAGASEAAGAAGAASAVGAGSLFAFPLTFALGDMLDTGSQDRASSIAAYEAANGPGSYLKFASDRDAGTGDFAEGGKYYGQSPTQMQSATNDALSATGGASNAGG